MTSKFERTFSSLSFQIRSPGQLPVLAIQIQPLPTPLRGEISCGEQGSALINCSVIR